uniref:Uncharacterized protein n=1 Tax=Octopus bimaculoides TaxID=37653 RepID=A0A0L8GQ24_OCTBM
MNTLYIWPSLLTSFLSRIYIQCLCFINMQSYVLYTKSYNPPFNHQNPLGTNRNNNSPNPFYLNHILAIMLLQHLPLLLVR